MVGPPKAWMGLQATNVFSCPAGGQHPAWWTAPSAGGAGQGGQGSKAESERHVRTPANALGTMAVLVTSKPYARQDNALPLLCSSCRLLARNHTPNNDNMVATTTTTSWLQQPQQPPQPHGGGGPQAEAEKVAVRAAVSLLEAAVTALSSAGCKELSTKVAPVAAPGGVLFWGGRVLWAVQCSAGEGEGGGQREGGEGRGTVPRGCIRACAIAPVHPWPWPPSPPAHM